MTNIYTAVAKQLFNKHTKKWLRNKEISFDLQLYLKLDYYYNFRLYFRCVSLAIKRAICFTAI